MVKLLNKLNSKALSRNFVGFIFMQSIPNDINLNKRMLVVKINNNKHKHVNKKRKPLNIEMIIKKFYNNKPTLKWNKCQLNGNILLSLSLHYEFQFNISINITFKIRVAYFYLQIFNKYDLIRLYKYYWIFIIKYMYIRNPHKF